MAPRRLWTPTLRLARVTARIGGSLSGQPGGTTRTRQGPSVGSWPAPIGASLEFPRIGSTGWLDATSSKGRSWLYKPLVADDPRRQDGDRKGTVRGLAGGSGTRLPTLRQHVRQTTAVNHDSVASGRQIARQHSTFCRSNRPPVRTPDRRSIHVLGSCSASTTAAIHFNCATRLSGLRPPA